MLWMWKSPRSSGANGGTNHRSTRAWATAPRLKSKPSFWEHHPSQEIMEIKANA